MKKNKDIEKDDLPTHSDRDLEKYLRIVRHTEGQKCWQI